MKRAGFSDRPGPLLSAYLFWGWVYVLAITVLNALMLALLDSIVQGPQAFRTAGSTPAIMFSIMQETPITYRCRTCMKWWEITLICAPEYRSSWEVYCLYAFKIQSRSCKRKSILKKQLFFTDMRCCESLHDRSIEYFRVMHLLATPNTNLQILTNWNFLFAFKTEFKICENVSQRYNIPGACLISELVWNDDGACLVSSRFSSLTAKHRQFRALQIMHSQNHPKSSNRKIMSTVSRYRWNCIHTSLLYCTQLQFHWPQTRKVSTHNKSIFILESESAFLYGIKSCNVSKPPLLLPP